MKKILHIASNFESAPNKFVPDLERFIANVPDVGNHTFFYFSNNDTDENKYKVTIASYIKLYKLISESELVVIHTLPVKSARLILPLIKGKCRYSLSIWGGEVHFLNSHPKVVRRFILKHLDKFFAKSLDGIITSINDDYNLFCGIHKKNYTWDGAPVFYPSNTIPEHIMPSSFSEKKYIMIGTSALQRNNHIEVMNNISEIGYPKNKKIFIPLSYGDFSYADLVEETAIKLFGEDNLYIERNFMSLTSYQEILNDVCFAIFDTEGQQGLGNIRNMLFLGAKIYLKKDTVAYNLLSKQGFRVYSADVIDFSPCEFRKQNYEQAKLLYSKESLRESLIKLFN
ncbi:TDP-N-acetylfucosamine:lipid II N-acetylfucosaminyltransferase [Vibrio hibernica]|uniref:TDP-N-acetylfucosamine:lipid II N-acetylfucosaminyltransferase n=1 Tax=Vibrio hibernica TaxID=2587465 RepID=UPI0039AFE324